MKKLLTTASAFALAVGLFASASASAAPVFPPPSAIPLDGFQVQAGGILISWLSFVETPFGESNLNINGPIIPAGFVAGIVEMTEGGGGPSDFFAIAPDVANPGQLAVGMISDGAAQSDIDIFSALFGGLPILGSIEETNQWQDVSAFYNQDPGFAYVVSDAEPVSWGILGIGLLGLGVARRRRTQKNLA